MRFNKQELVTIASQTPQNFDREGILVFKERHDGFFRRTEGYSARWFRLRGNLLFYLRGTEQLSEPMGVIVLGKHQVKTQIQDENGHWPFQIVCDNGDIYRMATYLESERTLWLKAIQSAPYDNLKIQIAALKDKLSRVPPIKDISTWRKQQAVVIDMNEIPLCELALSCDNLLCDSHGKPPSPMIVVNIKYSKGLCVRYGNTEVVDTCSNPSFSKTILFRACDGLNSDTIVSLIVYDVKERVSETMIPMGCTSLQLSTVQEAQRLRIALMNYNKKIVGFVTLNGWSLEPSYIGTSPNHSNDRNSIDIPQKVLSHRRSQSLPPRLGVKLKFPSVGSLLKINFVNSHQVTYRFYSGLGGDITVHEVMAEPKICFSMPIQLLDIFIQREKELLQEMLSIGEMSSHWKTKQLELVHSHISLLKHYWHSKRSMLSLPEGIYFKESSRKEDGSLEFAPVNLHLQRMWVHNDTLNKTGFHDIITAGAFTVHSNKSEKTEGLIRLVQQVKDINCTKAALNSATASKIQAEYDNILTVRRLRDETTQIMDKMALLVQNKRDISPLMEVLISKTRALVGSWDRSAVEEALTFVTWHRAKGSVVCDGQRQNVSTIQRLSEQLTKFELLNADYETLDASSTSSKEQSPNTEDFNLSASVPNICNRKNSLQSIIESPKLRFHNDYFKTETNVTIPTRLGRLSESQNRSFDCSFKNIPDFKSLTSLEHVTYRSLMNTERDNDQSAELHREAAVIQSASDDRHLFKTEQPMESDLEEALAAVVDSIQTVTTCCERSEQELSECVERLRERMEGLRSCMAELLTKLGLYHATLRLRCESVQWTRANANLQIRRDTCFSQALTTATAGIFCWLSSVPNDVVVKLLSSELGPLCGFEGLLSLYLNEKAMWGDMVVAIEDLHTVLFILVKSSHCSYSVPQVSGTRGSIIVHIPISDSLYAKFTSKEHLSFTITAVFFNVGVNQKATLAEALHETTPQAQSNSDNLDRLHKYYLKYRKQFPPDINVARVSSRSKPLEEVMENLRLVVHKKIPKNVEILHLAAQATRQMNGIRFTSCKSAKDRTGMSATIEQSNILAREYHLAEHEYHKAINILRSEGCRRENTLKNIGVRKYAFTKRQVAALPEEYRPPPGTYGSSHT